jgi:hypothetical protein
LWYGTAIASVFERREKRFGHLMLLNRFNASNFARSSQAAQAQSFSPGAKNPTVSGVNVVQVRTNRVAVPRQVPQYGIV